MEASKDTTNLRLTITVFYMMLQSAEAFVSQMGRVYPLQIGMPVHIAQLLEKLGPACGIIFPGYAEVIGLALPSVIMFVQRPFVLKKKKNGIVRIVRSNKNGGTS